MKKTRISGQQMPANIGKEVIILGSVNKVASSGNQIELTTLDGKIINVSFREPIDGNITEGYIECHGVVQSKATLLCHTYAHFPPDMCEQFDPEQYSDMLSIFNFLGNNKWKISETDTAN